MAPEQRLIDANVLEVKMGSLCDEFGTDHLFIDAIVYEIGNAPTVDAVEVVRCKDCKHYDLGVCLKIYSDGNMHTESWQSRRPEDFCSYGERKEGTDNG